MITSFFSANRHKLIYTRLSQRTSTTCLTSRFTPKIKRVLKYKRWSEKLSLNKDVWTRIFKSLKNICKETKLKEFQFKLIHRTIVTKKELFRFGVKTDDECLYCGDKDSIEHSFIECAFTKLFTQNVLNWFNQVNECQISPTTEETLFGITASSLDSTIIRKFNYIALFMRHYIYSSKLNSLAISIQDFISKLLIKYDQKLMVWSWKFFFNGMINWEVLLPPQNQYTV